MAKLPLDQLRHVHLVGIGGSGMNGIAEVLANQGHQVSGSDLQVNGTTQRLQACGIKVFQGHDAQHIEGADVVVISTAVAETNPEVQAARAARIPVISRAQMLAELMRRKMGIAVAGTHGKTTTTSLLSCILAEAGLDPTYVIGGLLKSAGSNAHLGTGHYFVAEADESDASFLLLHPQMAIVTNIDADHLGTYNNDFSVLKQTFIEFLHHLPFNGCAVVCGDDPIVNEIIPHVQRRMMTYGFSDGVDLQICDFKQTGFQSHFIICDHRNSDKTTEIILNLPGRHNALNATAAFGIAMQLQVDSVPIQHALAQFSGVGRRIQVHGELSVPTGKVTLIDDYGHHPREIAATIAAIRSAWPNRRLVVAFQPHRYTRTQALFQDFVTVLSEHIDVLMLLDVYSAGENIIVEASGDKLFEAISRNTTRPSVFVKVPDDLLGMLPDLLCDNDILLLQGAGNIGGIAAKLAAKFLPLSA